MSRLLSTAISSMKAAALGIDVRADNIANLNTTGFKAVRPSFATLLTETLREARSAGTNPGVNPVEVGGGVAVRSTVTDFTQGSLQHTGSALDMAIVGTGFFLLRGANGQEAYTRDGGFSLDSTGRLVHSASGLAVQGLKADAATNTISPNAVPEDIVIQPGLALNAKATANAVIGGNLDARAVAGDDTSMQFRYYDSLGVAHVMTVGFTKGAAAGSWRFDAYIDSPANAAGTGTIVFNGVGDLQTVTGSALTIPAGSPGLSQGANAPQTIALSFASLKQYAADSEAQAASQDGFQTGAITEIHTDPQGNIEAVFSNGQTRLLARLGEVNFTNVNGLARVRDNLFLATSNAGPAQIVAAGSHGTGTIEAQSLENSNADLATELTSLLVLQRGYQASSRLIASADEMLQEALNLKR
jgi:flagellar hook protein FlgE